MLSNTVLLLLVVCFTLGSSNGMKTEKYFREDYTYIEAVESFYKIHTTPQKWTEAKQTCALEGATLWHPDNDDEAREVKSFWTNTRPSIRWVYVGLSDIVAEGVFKTVDGKPATKVYNKWQPGQPNDRNGQQNCVYLYKDYYLDDWPCDYNYNFICKKSLQSLELPSQSNITVSAGLETEKNFWEDYTYIETVESFYKIHTTPRKWTDAKRTCALEGATLWHPDNDEEAREVKSFWTNTHPTIRWVYVGLSDIVVEGVFKTVDGKPATEVYNKWQPGQPNDRNGREDCVYLYKDYDLDDWPCDYNYNFICKKSLHSLELPSQCNITTVSAGLETEKNFWEDYTYIETVESYYKIHMTPRKWTDAKRTCALEGATLWHPDNDDEAREVKSFWTNTHPTIRWVYVGLSDIMVEGVFKTVDGKPATEVYNKWQPGQPNDRNGREDCVYLYKDYYLDDWSCEYNYNFICKKSLHPLQPSQCNISVTDLLKTEKYFWEDYTYIEAVKSFYKIHTTPQKWTDAKRTCALEGATLWHPDNDDEAREVKSFWTNTHPTIRWVYVGLSDIVAEGVFKTVDGKPATRVYNKWQPGQPNDRNGQQNCVYLYKDYYLDDWPCDYNYNFICKKSLHSLELPSQRNITVSDGLRDEKISQEDYGYIENLKSHYKIHMTPLNFTDAKQICVQEGATLFYPKNAEEANAVIAYWTRVHPSGDWSVLVGLTDSETEGEFKTIDGKPISDVYQKWHPGEPNDRSGEDCVQLYRNGKMNDVACDLTYRFICKKDYTKTVDNYYKIFTTPRIFAEANRLKEIRFAFETSDGKLIYDVYDHWLEGEPKNINGSRDCIKVNPQGCTDDISCDEQYGFICKSLPAPQWDCNCNMADKGYGRTPRSEGEALTPLAAPPAGDAAKAPKSE